MGGGYGNPFASFGMGQGYGTRFENMSDPQRQFYEQNPGAGYFNALDQQGLGGADKRSQWAQSQQGRYYNQFLAQMAQGNAVGRSQAGDPNMYWSGYLQNSVNPQSDFNALGPADRGDANMQAPRLRWLMSAI